ncbi:MAG: enoyl-CoA hydratase [Thermoproteota archaeon]|nr:MAG: enoyl-CoA hydratase [Candidatus Korarchaeota archaeon]RLG55091.1 MAG: enoyl-CoA hydratase [Candidatus Korarchaeota archaeon]
MAGGFGEFMRYVVAERDSVDSRILWVKLNAPERLNVLSSKMLEELYEALAEADRDDGVQAIILAGVGRAFSAGADLKEISASGFEEGVRWLSGYLRVIELLRETGKPVIAAVRGACVAGGHEIVMACDLIVAGRSAKLGQPEVIVGSTALGLGAQLLPLIVGEKRAREMLLTGRLLTAEEAYQAGLVNRVVDDEKVEEEARKLAQQIIDRVSPQAFRVIKSALKYWTDLAMLNLQLARDITAMVWASEEFRERAKDFLEKREMKPRKFTGVLPRKLKPQEAADSQ